MNAVGRTALNIQELHKHFGGVVTADNITISVREHEIYGVIGPNGAGKTTLFNMITGIFPPTSGVISLFNEDISGKRADEISKMGIARTFQNIRLFNSMTVFDNLLISCQNNMSYNMLQAALKTPAYRQQETVMKHICADALKKVNLYEMRDMAAEKLPYGMQRRLEIMRALVTGPKLLLLDEPAAGMNEEESAGLAELIRWIMEHYDITIIVIDHHMDIIMEVCDRISVINFGKLITTGTPEQVQNNREVIDAYLGVGE